MYDVDHGSCCSGPCNNHGHALRDTTGKQSWVLRAEMKEPGDLLYAFLVDQIDHPGMTSISVPGRFIGAVEDEWILFR